MYCIVLQARIIAVFESDWLRLFRQLHKHSSTMLATCTVPLFLYFFVLSLAVAQDPTVSSTRSSLFSSVLCPGDGVAQCGISQPRESHSVVSRGQCVIACTNVAGCNWFNFFVDDIIEINHGGRLCELFDRPPQLGIQPRCTLYKVSS